MVSKTLARVVKEGIIQKLKWFLKGFALGAVCLAPGISAGTMALVMGIYDKIVFSVTSLFPVSKKTKKSLIFLCCLTAGVVLSFVFLSKGMSRLLLLFPLQMYSFFTGLILASLPRLLSQTDFEFRPLLGYIPFVTRSQGSDTLKQERIKSKSLKSLLLILAVALGFFAFLNLTGLELGARLSKGFFWLFFVSGFLGLFASVLPGLSGSTVLLLLGSYSMILKALTEWKLTPLIVFSAGGLLGLVCAFYFVRLFLEKRRKLFFCLILGLILGSLPEIIPWANHLENKIVTITHILVFLFLGMAVLRLTEKKTTL